MESAFNALVREECQREIPDKGEIFPVPRFNELCEFDCTAVMQFLFLCRPQLLELLFFRKGKTASVCFLPSTVLLLLHKARSPGFTKTYSTYVLLLPSSPQTQGLFCLVCTLLGSVQNRGSQTTFPDGDPSQDPAEHETHFLLSFYYFMGPSRDPLPRERIRDPLSGRDPQVEKALQVSKNCLAVFPLLFQQTYFQFSSTGCSNKNRLALFIVPIQHISAKHMENTKICC